MKKFTYVQYKVHRRLVTVNAEDLEDAEFKVKYDQDVTPLEDWEEDGPFNPEYVEDEDLDDLED
jgi:hypothetical protein